MPTRPKAHDHEQRTAHRVAAAKQYDRARGSSTQRGYDSKWTAYAKRFRQHSPWCVMCQANGLIQLAEVVDHIKPAKHFPELFWDESNHQSLCIRCNTRKAAKDLVRYGSR